MIERVLMMLAVLLLLAAAVLLWRDQVSAAFVTATIGLVAWFLNYRFRLRASLPKADDDIENGTEREHEEL